MIPPICLVRRSPERPERFSRRTDSGGGRGLEPPGRSRRREPGEPVGHERADRACSLRAKGIRAERASRQGVCGRHGGTEERLTWGNLVAFPEMVFMPPSGPKSRRGRPGHKATPKCRDLATADRFQLVHSPARSCTDEVEVERAGRLMAAAARSRQLCVVTTRELGLSRHRWR